MRGSACVQGTSMLLLLPAACECTIASKQTSHLKKRLSTTTTKSRTKLTLRVSTPHKVMTTKRKVNYFPLEPALEVANQNLTR